MSDKTKFPLKVAQTAALRIATMLQPITARIEIAGSIRRRKEMVGDIEIIYVPKYGEIADETDLFKKPVHTNLVDAVLDEWIKRGWITKRLNKLGHPAWGPENKLAVAVKSGIPVDFFATSTRHWHNYLVCRTGSAEHNTLIATRALERGWRWNPTGAGFSRQRADGTVELEPMSGEREVFAFVGLPYKEPWER